jgi:hypothetical protein
MDSESTIATASRAGTPNSAEIERTASYESLSFGPSTARLDATYRVHGWRW